MTGPTICVVGSLNMDTTLRVGALPGAGETILAHHRHVSPGGKGANQAAAAAATADGVAMVGAVGDDAAGDTALESLRGHGVDVSGVAIARGRVTGTAMVLVADDGENLIVVDPGANGVLDPSWVTDRLAALRPTITLAQLEIPVECLDAVAQSDRRGMLVVNPAPMPDDGLPLETVLAAADVLTPNRGELGRLAGRSTPRTGEEVDECVAALGFGGHLVVTLGSDGAAVYPADGGRIAVPAESVRVLDTSGAGDVFCGVLVARLAAGVDLVDAVHDANHAAALSTTLPGAQIPPHFAASMHQPSAASRYRAAPSADWPGFGAG